MTEEPPNDDMSTRQLIVKNFAQAGPWALLTLLLIVGLGYQANWFVAAFLDSVTSTMKQLNENDQKMHRMAEQQIETTHRIQQGMQEAHETMAAAPSERAMQTQLLQDIKHLLENGRPARP